jgi:hypothetical protein
MARGVQMFTRRAQRSESRDADGEGVAAYFTGADEARAAFTRALESKCLDKRVFVVHGVGGVGKSSLLRMFRLHCHQRSVPVGLAAEDEAQTSIDVLVKWSEDMKSAGVRLTAFSKTLDRYLGAQANADKQPARIWSALGDAAGAGVGGAVVGLGPAAILGAAAGQASIEWLTRAMSGRDRDLLLAPSRELTSDFVEATSEAASKRRLVLMLDAFEKSSTKTSSSSWREGTCPIGTTHGLAGWPTLKS